MENKNIEVGKLAFEFCEKRETAQPSQVTSWSWKWNQSLVHKNENYIMGTHFC